MGNRNMVEYIVLLVLGGIALPAILKLVSRERSAGRQTMGLSLLLAFLSQIPIFNLIVLYIIAFFMGPERQAATHKGGLLRMPR